MNLEDKVDNYLRMYLQYDKPITREQADEINEYVCELKNKIYELQIRIEDFSECDREDYRPYKQGYIRQSQVIDKAIEYIETYDVFEEFSFPLMKRDEENQIKSSIKYEFDTSIKKNLLEILKGKSE